MELPKNFCEYVIPEGEYAVFECVGAVPKALQDLQRNIIKDWLPSSGYEYANLPDVEVYFEGDRNKDDYKCEIWLPVIKRIRRVSMTKTKYSFDDFIVNAGSKDKAFYQRLDKLLIDGGYHSK